MGAGGRRRFVIPNVSFESMLLILICSLCLKINVSVATFCKHYICSYNLHKYFLTRGRLRYFNSLCLRSGSVDENSAWCLVQKPRVFRGIFSVSLRGILCFLVRRPQPC